MRELLIVAASLALPACGGTGPSTAELCNAMIKGDSEAAEDIRRDGVEPSELCACLGTTVDAMAENQKAAHIGVMKAVTAIRVDNNVGVETAAERLEDELRAGTGNHTFTEDDFDNTGQLLGDLSNQLEDGGACKAG